MILSYLTHLADSGTLYAVNLDAALTIPIVYVVPLLICVLLREFTHGWLRYILAILFTISFAVLWYVLMLDYSPWQVILPVIAIIGGISGLWNWIRDVFKDVEKL